MIGLVFERRCVSGMPVLGHPIHLFMRVVLLHEQRAFTLIYSTTLLYGFVQTMLGVLIPLYALHLTQNYVTVGAVVSIQGIFQILLRFFGGYMADAFGEHRVLAFSYGFIVIGGIILVHSDQLAGIIAAQLIIGASRSVFWFSSQSYTSHINEAMSDTALGKLSGFENVGNVMGFLLSGISIAYLGYQISFALCSFIGGSIFALSFMMPVYHKHGLRLKLDLSPLFRAMRCKPFYIAGLSAFTAAVPFVLMYSFYPVYFKEIGYSETAIGGITALLSVGYIIIGFTYGKLETLLGRKLLLLMGMAGTGIWIILSPYFANMWIYMILITGLGVTGGLSNVVYQLLTTQFSTKEHLNVSLAFVGLFWALAQLIVPVCFGWMAEVYGFTTAFSLCGLFIMLMSLTAPFLYTYIVRK